MQVAQYSKSKFSFDEPAIKTTFQVELVIPSHLSAVSNTSIESEEELAHGRKRVIFQRTPRMSTYLLAWIVGDFEVVEDSVEITTKSDPNTLSKHSVLIRAHVSKGYTKDTLFAMDIAKKALQFFSEQFNLPYSLPKIDLVSVKNLDALAMENWGCLVFREYYFLTNENTSLPLKQRIARLVAHEICHQWFGNLVSISHWKYLWLKV